MFDLFCPYAPEFLFPDLPPQPAAPPDADSERSPSGLKMLVSKCDTFRIFMENELLQGGMKQLPPPGLLRRFLAIVAMNGFGFVEEGMALFREASLFSHACGGNVAYSTKPMNAGELRAQPPPEPPIPACRLKAVNTDVNAQGQIEVGIKYYPPDVDVPPLASGRDHVGVFTATRDIEAGEMLTFRSAPSSRALGADLPSRGGWMHSLGAVH